MDPSMRHLRKSPALSLGFTSVEGLVVTSKGNFFRSAWERMGVVFCRVNMMRRSFAYLVHSSKLFLEPHSLGQWANKKEHLGHSPTITSLPFSLRRQKFTNTKLPANYRILYD